MSSRRLAWLLAPLLLVGCASFGEGVGRAVFSQFDGAEGEDTRACEIEGPAFSGTLAALELQDGQPPIGSVAGDERALLKVIMVHGIGTHRPGYSGTLSANLTRTLGLDVASPQVKTIEIVHAAFPGETLGTFTARRFTDAARERELIFYELTWSELTAAARARLHYDGSDVHTRNRAGFNRLAKGFANDVLVDPLAYVGVGRERILGAVRQGVCWAFSTDWDGFPVESAACRQEDPRFGSRLDKDHFFYVTHSLGSRIVLDALQTTASTIDAQLATNPGVEGAISSLRGHNTAIFMLANQLPLLQAGFDDASAAGQSAAYCLPEGELAARRLLARTDIIAFNDPNDILSYPIPDDFVQQDIDSRLCPRAVNVTLNIATVTRIPGLGEFANPLAAHSNYDADERVIGLIAGGLGAPETLPIVEERCSWIRTEDDLR